MAAPVDAAAPPPAAPAPAAPAFALPGSRALAVASLCLLLAGTVIGAALAPPADETLAAGRRVILVRVPAARAVATGVGTAPATGPAATSPVAAAAPVASAGAGAPAPVDPGTAAPVDVGATPAPAPAPPSTAPPAPASKPSIGHVVLLLMPWRPYAQSFGAPGGGALAALARRGVLLRHYEALGPGAAANRIALVSGRAPGPGGAPGCAATGDLAIPTDAASCRYGAEVKTLADQLLSRGLTWRSYVEGRPRPCAPNPGDPGDVATLDPFVRFHSVIDLPDCGRSALGLDRLTADLATARRTPTLSLVAPASCRAADPAARCPDGAPGGPAGADAFLRRWVPAILASPAYRADGLLVVTSDGPPANAPPAPAGGADDALRAGALVLSRWARAGASSDRPYDHDDLLRTTERMLGLEPLARAGGRGVRPFGRDVFARDLTPLAAPQI